MVLQDADLHKGAQGSILQALVWPYKRLCAACSGPAQPKAGTRHGMLGWGGIAVKLTRDGGLAPTQQMRDFRDGFAANKKKEYLFALKWCKMGVVAQSLLYRYFRQTPL